MSNFESDLTTKVKQLETENLLLRNIIKIQKGTLDHLIEHCIVQDFNKKKE